MNLKPRYFEGTKSLMAWPIWPREGKKEMVEARDIQAEIDENEATEGHGECNGCPECESDDEKESN